MKIKKKSITNPLEQIKRINEKGFKVYLGDSNINTLVFSPNGEVLSGCVMAVKIIEDANDMLRKVELKGLVKLITEEEKDELLKINEINKKEMNG